MSRSPKKLKFFIEDPYVVDVKVHVLSFNMILISSPQLVPTPNKIPNVAHLRVQAVSLNLNLVSSPQSVPKPSYTFRYKFGRSGKGSFTERAKIVDRGSICSAPECAGSQLQCEPFLFSVACSYTQLSISGKLGRSGKGSFTEKSKIVNRGSICFTPESTGNMNPFSSPQRVPRPIYQFW